MYSRPRLHLISRHTILFLQHPPVRSTPLTRILLPRMPVAYQQCVCLTVEVLIDGLLHYVVQCGVHGCEWMCDGAVGSDVSSVEVDGRVSSGRVDYGGWSGQLVEVVERVEAFAVLVNLTHPASKHSNIRVSESLQSDANRRQLSEVRQRCLFDHLSALTISRLLTGPFSRWKPYMAAPIITCVQHTQ